MRNISRRQPALALGLAVASGLLTWLAAGPAAAQTETGLHRDMPKYPFAIRAGAFFPINGHIRQDVGPAFFSVDADWSIQSNPGQERVIISVGYIHRSDGDRKLDMIPLTIGQFHYSGEDPAMRPYIGYGAGMYSVSESLTNDVGDPFSKTGIGFGGFIAAGADFQEKYFLDARYHYVTHVGPFSADGIEITGGARF
jgi:hypothetical protein